MTDVAIPEDYVSGRHCLEYEIPWITPAAVQRLHALIRPTDVVLDLGVGGSTLFYARRASVVIAVEPNLAFLRRVEQTIAERAVTNVIVVHAPTQAALERVAADMTATVFSVDMGDGFDRDRAFLAGMRQPRDVVVLDNYGCPQLWPASRQQGQAREGYGSEDYNDPSWRGFGTRILTRR